MPERQEIKIFKRRIEDAAKRGFRLFDFLRGDEEYKFRMGAKPTIIHNLTIKR